MAELDSLENAGKLLQSAELGEIITALGLGIAKAQAAMDNNSIAQLQKLSEIEVGGKSLLELGFVPAFYVFDFADVSASVSFKLRKVEAESFGLTVNFELATQLGYSKEDLDFLSEQEENRDRNEYRGSRTFLMKANETETITVQNKTISMNYSEGCVTRVEQFLDEIREAEDVARVDLEIAESEITNLTAGASIVKYLDGYISLFWPESSAFDIVIIAVQDYPSVVSNIDLNPPNSFGVNTDFLGTINAINNTIEYFGFMGGQYFSSPIGKPIEVFFNYNSYFFDTSYQDISPSDNQSYSNSGMEGILDIIALILRSDSTAKIQIVGHTDSTGSQGNAQSGNLKLGMDRAKAIRSYLLRKGASSNQVSVESKGETLDNSIAPTTAQRDIRFRKASLTFINNRDYFFLKKTDLASNITLPTTFSDFGIIYLGGSTASIGSIGLTQYGTSGTFTINQSSELSSNSFLGASLDTFTAEYLHGMTYLLHNKSTLSFTAYSQSEEEITMVRQSESGESLSETEDRYLLSESQNSKTRIKKSSEKIKNPTTIAVGASIDYRTSREFEISMEGNASISARLKTVPPPDEFKNYIQEAFVSNSGQ